MFKRLMFTQECTSKRLRLSPEGQSVSISSSFRQELQGIYGRLPDNFLWNTHKVWHLIQPTFCFGADTKKFYKFIGRTRAEELLKRFLELQPGEVLQVQGAKGSGKTTVVSSIAGYLIAVKKKRIVYICASRFMSNPEEVLKHALLVATGDESLAEMTTLEEMLKWCCNSETLMFVVDDWDALYSRFQKQLLHAVSIFHILVRVTSRHSRDSQLNLVTRNKLLPTFEFDGPYSSNEMSTWMSAWTLANTKAPTKDHLDMLTGGMPGLLQLYEEVDGQDDKFSSRVDELYASVLNVEFIRKVKPSEATNLMVRGVLPRSNVSTVVDASLSCFYLDNSDRLRLLSPLLRYKAEKLIIAQHHKAEGENLFDFTEWLNAVCLDSLQSSSPICWKLEGLVIAVMQDQGKVQYTHGDTGFNKLVTYSKGKELETIMLWNRQETLEAGIFFVPEVLDGECLHVKLVDNIIHFHSVHIIVSKLKIPGRGRWIDEVLPKWKQLVEHEIVEKEVIHVMPQSMVESYIYTEDIIKPEFIFFRDVNRGLAPLDGLKL